MNVNAKWLSTYLTLELEWDSPIMEAVVVYWRYIVQEVDDFEGAPGDSEKALRIKHHRITPTALLVVLSRDGMLLRHVPKQERTESMCALAVSHTGYAIQFVPHPSQALCLAAVRSTPGALKWIHIDSRTYSVCCAALERDGMTLAHIPQAMQEEHPTYCIIAVNQNLDALQYVRVMTPTVRMAVAHKQLALAAAASPPLQAQLDHIMQQIRVLYS